MTEIDDRRYTAHHEAGHAVFRVFSRMPFDLVTIDEATAKELSGDGDACGYVHIADPGPVDRFDYGLMTGAGPAAEAYLASEGCPEATASRLAAWADDEREDVGESGEAANILGSGHAELLAQIVTHRWDAITAVAQALMDSAQLDFAEVTAIVGGIHPYVLEVEPCAS